MDSGKREKAAGIPRSLGELTCEEALAVSGETSGGFFSSSRSTVVCGPCSLGIRA